MASQSRFEIYPEGDRWRWRYLGPDEREVMASADTFNNEQSTLNDIDQLRDALQQRTVIQTARGGLAGFQRWRPIAPDGTIGQPAPEPPDEPDEGETGPAEARDFCRQPDCTTDTSHFAH